MQSRVCFASVAERLAPATPLIDAFSTTFRVTRELGWVGLDRLLAFGSTRREGIPESIEAIQPDWLGSALEDAFPGVRVAEIEHLGGHSGTTTRARLRVDYATAPAGAPETIFVKLTPPDAATRLFNGLMQLGRTEVDFYRDIRPHLPILAPNPFCGRAARHGSRFVLLLDDLTTTGARFATIDAPISLDEVKNVMRLFGRLHASQWQSPRLETEWRWLRSFERNRNLPLERWISARSNAPCIERYADILPKEVRERSGLIHVHRNALERYWSAGPRTLIHGDSHVGNMFFRKDEVGLLDWQVVQHGQGIRDVGYFLMNSVDIEMRRGHERELVELYVETLRSRDVPDADLDPDLLWDRYRSQSLYVWIASSVTATMARLQPAEVKRRALERASAALLDHDAFALLDNIATA